MNKNVRSISDLPSHFTPVNVGDGTTETVFKENVLYLPIENDVDLKIEAEVAARTQQQREAGYRMFLDGVSTDKIAEQLKVPIEAIRYWAKDGDWATRLKKRNDMDETVIRENVRRLRLSHAQSEAEESINLGKQIRGVVKKKFDDDKEGTKLTPMGIKNLADAAKVTGDLSAQGMGETAQAKQEGGGGGRTPLVVMFNGGLPPIIKVVEDAK